VELLGQLPLDIKIREHADSGTPSVVAEPDGRTAEIYRSIARRLAVKVDELSLDHSALFAKIVIEDT
jgi:ATP-binding protein involved in chromosome partitioning